MPCVVPGLVLLGLIANLQHVRTTHEQGNYLSRHASAVSQKLLWVGVWEHEFMLQTHVGPTVTQRHLDLLRMPAMSLAPQLETHTCLHIVGKCAFYCMGNGKKPPCRYTQSLASSLFDVHHRHPGYSNQVAKLLCCIIQKHDTHICTRFL